MAELVDAMDSKSIIERCVGSSPTLGTKKFSEKLSGENVLNKDMPL